MENWGCVTWTDARRSTAAGRPTPQREYGRDGPAARDGAHVVRRPGDHALVGRPVAQRGLRVVGRRPGPRVRHRATPTPGRPSWPTLELARLPGRTWARPPTRSAAEVPDVAHAFANFDAITYAKGQAVLRQLVAYVGEDAFVEGLRAYFRDHAWGNTEPRRPDAARSARPRAATSTAWTASWLDRAGTDTIVLLPDPGRRTAAASCSRARTAASRAGTTSDRLLPPYGTATPRGRRAGRRPPTSRPPARRRPLGPAGRRPAPAQRRRPDLRRRSAPTRRRSRRCSTWRRTLPDAALAGRRGRHRRGTCWPRASCRPATSSTACCAVLATERSPGVVEPFFALALRAAEQWSPTALVPRRLARVADVAARRADETDHRTAALRTLAAAATTPEHFELLDREPPRTTSTSPGGCSSAGRRSAGTTRTAVQALLDRDPDPDAAVRALARARGPADRGGQGGGLGADLRGPGRARRARRSIEVAAPSGGPSSTTCWCRGPTATSRQVTALRGEGMLATLSLVRHDAADDLRRRLAGPGPGRRRAPRTSTRWSATSCSPPRTPWPGCCRATAPSALRPSVRLSDGRVLRPRSGSAAPSAARSPRRPGPRRAGAAGSGASAARGAPAWRRSRGAPRGAARRTRPGCCRARCRRRPGRSPRAGRGRRC